MRLIDADAIVVRDTVGGQNDFADCIRDAVQAVLDNAHTINAIVIPENATNGDMIKAMFPWIFTSESSAEPTLILVHGIDNGSIVFEKEWWNAPYKGV